MPDEYMALVTAMKSLTQESGITSEPAKGLPVGQDEWDKRPDVDSYGVIALEFETDHMDGDNRKQHRAYEGSMDLYSRKRDGDGWIPLIENVLTDHCDSCWRLEYHTYEKETKLYRWEWVFQIEG